MEFDFPKLIGQLSDEERIRFYEILAHNLTVTVRGVWSDEKLTDHEKVERLKWINEILHRVTMKAAYLRMNRNLFSEIDSWEDINHWVRQCPEIETSIEWTLKMSYESCKREPKR